MAVSVGGTEKAIEGMASQDMNFALQSRDRVEEIMGRVESIARAREAAIGDLGAAAERADAQVARAVQALEFQDTTSRLLAHIGQRVRAVDDLLAAMRGLAAELPHALAAGGVPRRRAGPGGDALHGARPRHTARSDSGQPLGGNRKAAS